MHDCASMFFEWVESGPALAERRRDLLSYVFLKNLPAVLQIPYPSFKYIDIHGFISFVARGCLFIEYQYQTWYWY